MSKFLMRSTSALVLAIAVNGGAAKAAGFANTLFFQMSPNLESNTRTVFIFGAANTQGTVSGADFSQSFDLGTQGFATVLMPASGDLSSNIIENKGFRVDANAPISGYFLNRATFTTDMTYLIDGARLGSDYVVASYQNIFDDQISVQATRDNTVVSFLPPGGEGFQQTLNAGQTYQFTSSRELTGTRITANAPIAVFGGNQCTNVPTNNFACDHIVEQMPSIDQLSSTYFLAQTPRTGALGNVVRVVGTDADTEVRINGALVATLGSGEFYEGRVVGGQQLVASKPVLVAQYLIGQDQALGANTDPAMTVVPGADQWLNSYVFATPSGDADFPDDFVTVVIQTNDLPTLTVDSILVNPDLFNPIASSAYSFGSIDVSATSGPFAITAASPFMLLLSGADNFDSYFTYGGAAFSPGASPPADGENPPPPPPPPASTPDVYWDGDGNPGDGIIQGGNGILTSTSINLTQQTGAANNSLPVRPANIIFGGAPGVVTIDTADGDIDIAGLFFRVDGYKLTGDPITLVGAGDAVNVIIETGGTTRFPGEMEAQLADPTVTAQIDAPLVGLVGVTKIGAGTLILTGENTYAGGTEINEGRVIGNSRTFGTGSIVNLGELIFQQDIDGIFGQGIGGSGALNKTGVGKLTITGDNAITGTTQVAQGMLQVDGNLGGSLVTVASGARLGGNGTIGGLVVRSGGVVAPGQSIGTMNISGDALFETGSVYELELNSLGASDRIVATGAATVQSGAILQLIKVDAPRYQLGTRYTVLSAEDGRTGLFTLAGTTRVSQFINVVQSADANNVYLDVLKTRAFVDAALTPNQRAAASGADAPANGAMFTAIAYLQTDAEAQSAFDQISGELHASVRAVSFEDSRFIREAVTNRLAITPPGEPGLWMHGYGSWGRFDGDSNAAEVRRNVGGFFLGAEVVNSVNFAAGILGGFGTGDLRTSPATGPVSGNADFEDIHLGAYAAVRSSNFTAKLGLAHMWRDIKTRRSFNFPGFSDTLNAKYDLRLFQAYADVGLKISATNSLALEPFASLAYVTLNASTFRETGGSAALATVGSNSTDMVFTNLGTRVHAALGGMNVLASAAWRHAGGEGRNETLSMGFGAGPAFDISGVPLAKDAAALSLQLSGNLTNSLSVGVGYSGQIGSRLSDHGVRGNITLRF